MEEKKKFDRKKYQVEFSRDNYRFYAFKIRNNREELINWINSHDNMSGYVINLIEEDMKKQKKGAK